MNVLDLKFSTMMLEKLSFKALSVNVKHFVMQSASWLSSLLTDTLI